jgi:membrane-bound ClpP family serine protease
MSDTAACIIGVLKCCWVCREEMLINVIPKALFLARCFSFLTVGNSIYQGSVKVFRFIFRGVLSSMSREDWACVCLIILGILLFLVGANYYNSLVGWLGVFLFVGGILALIILYVYNSLTKPKSQSESQTS